MTTTASPRTNWAGNIAFAAPDFYRPASLAELRAVVARARQVRVLGTGHSFNDMADSPGAQVSLAGLPPEVEVDSAAALVRVAAGLTYSDLASRWTGSASRCATWPRCRTSRWPGPAPPAPTAPARPTRTCPPP